jgi:hypothetical protein
MTLFSWNRAEPQRGKCGNAESGPREKQKLGKQKAEMRKGGKV